MSTIEQATTVLEAHGYSVCAEAVAELEKDRDRLLGQRQDQSVDVTTMGERERRFAVGEVRADVPL